VLISLPTCLDCDRVVRSPGRCRTCALALDLARRSAAACEHEPEAAAPERLELRELGAHLSDQAKSDLALLLYRTRGP
jgi:hypothetical protein